ncbi:MAG: penicillin-binding protein 1C [Elusimicrobiota bacterium]
MRKKIILIPLLLLSVFTAFFKLSQRENFDFSSKKIYDRNGILLREIASSEYGTAYPVKLESLPQYFIETLIITEDKRFFYHPGIDPIAILRAIKQNIQSKKITSGSSTITQQLIRNIEHYPRTIPFKIMESLRAVCWELRYSKKIILSEYLNRIPYGNGAYGIEAAARLYLAKPAKDLSLAESAFLCALPCSNKLYNPYRNFISVLQRQKRILTGMYLKGKINKAGYFLALQENISLYPKQNKFLAPHFCYWVAGKENLPEQIKTTLDYNLQRKIEFTVNNHLAKLERANVTNAAVAVLNNRTAEVLALIGSADFFDETHSGQVNGAQALRQPGSTVKPFVYGLAMEKGFTASSTLPDLESNIKTNAIGFFTPKNYDNKYHGMVRLRTALACSYNVATANLADLLGPDLILAKLRQAGLKSLKKEAKFYGPGLSLGSGETSLLEMVRAYSALANEGRLTEVRILIDEPQRPLGTVFSPQIAYLLTDILSDNQARQPAFGEFSPLNLPFSCAAKTGTSKNFRDNWTIGYTPDYTVGVWVGNFNGKAMYSVSGISGSGPIFRDIMLILEIRKENSDFLRPPGLEKKTICAKSGNRPNRHCQELLEEIYLPGTVPREICRLHQLDKIDKRNGLIAQSDCPEKFIEKKVYEKYPLLYDQWAKSAGIQQPPDGESAMINLAGVDHKQNLWDIEFPKDGDIFKIDPILRKEYQTVTLKPKIADQIKTVRWFIDNQLITDSLYPYTASWSLKEGKHLIRFIAFHENGREYRSQNIKITVLP